MLELVFLESGHTCKKVSDFPSQAGMSLTKLFLAGNNQIFPGQGEFGAWGRKIDNLFYSVVVIQGLV
jgi:hypothetical protein